MGLQRFQLWVTRNETATNVMRLPIAISSRAVFSEYDQKPGWLMRFCNGIPNDRYRIVADENRWPAGSASPFRDGRGVQRLPSRCCGARLARPHLPPGPLPLPHGERKGGTWGAGANAWWPAHAMAGYARYEPHATSGFLIRLLGTRPYHCREQE